MVLVIDNACQFYLKVRYFCNFKGIYIEEEMEQ